MKNTAAILGLGLFLVACGGEKSEYEKYYESDYKADTTKQVTGPVPQASGSGDAAGGQVLEKGAKLIASSDCLSCHRENEKLIGPAYADVAKKYELNDKNVDYLASKIIEGGSGVWGQVPMTPHPNIGRQDAEEMAKYVLALNK